MPNRFQQIIPGSDVNQQIAMLNKNFAELDNENITKVFYNSAGNIGVTQGLLPNGLGEGTLLSDANGIPLIVMYVDANNNPVLKVAKSGQDATTASNDQLSFNSAQNVFQIVTTLTASFSVTSAANSQGSTTITINHNLGYIPLTENSVQVTTSNWNGRTGVFPIPYLVPGSNSASGAFIIASYIRVSNVTTTQITYEAGIIAGSFTLAGTITCYVKQQTAT
jgi:hypothetical protein